MNEEEYINERLDDQINWYDKKSQFNQKWYKRLQIIEIVLAASLPLLSGFQDSFQILKWFLGGIGILIVISASINTLYKFHENWIQYRTTTETLKHEKYLFSTKVEPYDNPENSFSLFVNNVERIISKENSCWANYSNENLGNLIDGR